MTSTNKETFILMSDKDKKEFHKKEQMRHKKPKNMSFDIGDYVSIDRETMTVYNCLCPEYNIHNLYGFVSYDEENHNTGRDYINIVRFRRKEE